MSPVELVQPKVRTLIHGSCVSRDTFEFLDPGLFDLTTYVARQSVISAMGPPTAPPDGLGRLDSAFQRRMIEGDATSSLPALLRERASKLDLVVLDLFDERLGVFEHPDGSFTTDSVELRTLGEYALIAGSLHHPFGGPEHSRLFEAALTRYRDLLVELDLHGRTVLLAPPWAATNREGGEPTPSFGDRAEAMQPVADHYVAMGASVLGVPVLGEGLDVRADPEHRWGSAPFHYDDDTYAALAAQIGETLPDGPRSFGASAVRITTLRRVGAAPVVTLRQVGAEQIEATVRAHDAKAYAFHLYSGTEQVQKVHYRRSPTHTFDVGGHGTGPFHVRAFVKDSAGGRTPVLSERLRLTR